MEEPHWRILLGSARDVLIAIAIATALGILAYGIIN